MQDAEEKFDVIVVGAGLSGLKAALELEKTGKRVLVLEARERVGGRSMAGEIAGQVVDFGGQWVGPQQTMLLAQAQELGVATYPQYTKGASLVSIDGVVSSYMGGIPKLPLPALLEVGMIERRLRRDVQTLGANEPWLAVKAAKWDAESVESWIRDSVYTSAARDFLRTVVGALICAEPAQVSYLYFLDVLRRCGGLQSMIDVKGGAQQDKFVGGAWQIPKLMADRLAGRIELNSPVLAVEQDEDGVRITSAKGIHRASRAIIATPPGVTSRIRFNPQLPPRRAALLQRMPMGSVIKVHVAYETPFWRKRGLNGSVASTTHHLGVVFDQTLDDERVGVLVGLIEGRHAVAMSALDRAQRRSQIVSDLAHYFGPDAGKVVDYVEQDWLSEEWSLGGYAAHMPPGVMTSYGDALRQPTGRIHWAGTETATEYPGYLEGALRAGVRAASEAALEL